MHPSDFVDVGEQFRFWKLASRYCLVVGVCQARSLTGRSCDLFVDHLDFGFPHWSASPECWAWRDGDRTERFLNEAAARDMITPVRVEQHPWLTWRRWLVFWLRSFRWQCRLTLWRVKALVRASK